MQIANANGYSAAIAAYDSASPNPWSDLAAAQAAAQGALQVSQAGAQLAQSYAQADAQEGVEESQADATTAQDNADALAEETQTDSDAGSADAEGLAQAAATDNVFDDLPDTLVAPSEAPVVALTPDRLSGYDANDFYLYPTVTPFGESVSEFGIGWETFAGVPDYAMQGITLGVGQYFNGYSGGMELGLLGDTPGPWQAGPFVEPPSAARAPVNGLTYDNPIAFGIHDVVRGAMPETSDYQIQMHFTGGNAELLDLANTPSNIGQGGYSQSTLPTTFGSTQLANPVPVQSMSTSLEDVPAQTKADGPETGNQAGSGTSSQPGAAAIESTDATPANAGPAGTLTIVAYVPQADAAEESADLENRAQGEKEEDQANEPAPELKTGANAAAAVAESVVGAVVDQVQSTVPYKVLNAALDVAAALLSSGEAVGHHYVNVATVKTFYKQGKLSDEAYYIAMGFYSGATEPAHVFGTYGGVTHAQYNKEIMQALSEKLKALKASPTKPMTGDAMLKFIQKEVLGLTADDDIQAFNRVVRAQAKAFQKANPHVPVPSTLKKDLIAQGKKFVKNNGPRLASLAAFLVAAGGADQFLGALPEFAEEKSRVRIEFDRALKSLENNDIDGANFHIVGNGQLNGMTGELRAQGFDKAAASLEELWRKMIRESQLEQYEAMAKLSAQQDDDTDVPDVGGASTNQGSATGKGSSGTGGSSSPSLIDLESLLGKVIAVAGGPAGDTLEEAYLSTLPSADRCGNFRRFSRAIGLRRCCRMAA